MRRLLVMAVLSLLLGCQQPPAPAPSTAPMGPVAGELRAEGDQLAARGEYAEAADKYRAAVEREPRDGSLWYALGVALSHLGRREETIDAFGRVVDLGQPDSQEAQVARAWLVRAGVLAESVSFASRSSRSGDTNARRSVPPPSPGPQGSLTGKTEWKGVSVDNLISLRIVLSADGGQRFSRRIRLGGSYEFKNLPPGTYRLRARAAQTQLWDERLTIEVDKQTVLNLSPANSLVSTNEFPGELHQDPGYIPGS